MRFIREVPSLPFSLCVSVNNTAVVMAAHALLMHGCMCMRTTYERHNKLVK